MFKNKLLRYRPKVLPEIGKIYLFTIYILCKRKLFMVFYLGERSNWDSEVKEQSLPYPPLKRRAEISALEVLLTYPNFPFHILCSVD